MTPPFAPDAAYPDGLPALATPRLRLRPLAAPDDDALVALFSDERALATWGAARLATTDAARAYRAALALGFASRSLLVWGVEAGGVLAGIGVLVRWAPHHRRVTLGYYLGSDHWGRGLATEAAAALVGFAFGVLDVWRVEAETVVGNDASKRVLAKLGFVHEARLAERLGTPDGQVDADLFRLLRPEWEAAR